MAWEGFHCIYIYSVWVEAIKLVICLVNKFTAFYWTSNKFEVEISMLQYKIPVKGFCSLSKKDLFLTGDIFYTACFTWAVVFSGRVSCSELGLLGFETTIWIALTKNTFTWSCHMDRSASEFKYSYQHNRNYENITHGVKLSLDWVVLNKR